MNNAVHQIDHYLNSLKSLAMIDGHKVHCKGQLISYDHHKNGTITFHYLLGDELCDRYKHKSRRMAKRYIKTLKGSIGYDMFVKCVDPVEYINVTLEIHNG